MLPVKRLRLNQNLSEIKRVQARNATLLKSIERFTTDLYKCIANHEKGNFVCSSLSVHLLLAMCALGAQKNTAKEILEALYLAKDNLSDDFKNVINYLENVSDIQLNIVNRIFVADNIVLKDTFKEEVSDFFLSDVIDVDFASQLEESVQDINDWIVEKTENKIKQILSKGDVDSSTRMILVNAVYFKASWLDSFSFGDTQNEPFFIDKETKIEVPTMHKKSSFMYKDLKRYNAECIAIPFKNRNFLFIIIKPKQIDGLELVENNLHKIELDFDDRLGKKCNFVDDFFHLTLPKFKIESKVDLNDYLPKLGMIEMFTEEANFEGISDEPILTPPLHVDKVLQKAFIEVNEKEIEAATAGYVALRGGGAPQWRDFKVDRPFLYRIVHARCNLTLFSGRVTKPIYD